MLNVVPKGTGWLEVICGCMFSGKTEELIRRLRRARIARMDVVIFKPGIDERYELDDIVSHSEQRLESIRVESAREIEERAGNAQVVGIDEAQFISGDLLGVVRRLANRGKRVIISGLDTDYRGVPFEPMPALMCEAEVVTKLLAVCHRCGAPAHRTQRIRGGRDRVQVGGQGEYEARCRTCFEPPDDSGELVGQGRLFNGD
ncbi:thymidine kinase [bacterium]|nr:thymidine kinase [bacterium]